MVYGPRDSFSPQDAHVFCRRYNGREFRRKVLRDPVSCFTLQVWMRDKADGCFARFAVARTDPDPPARTLGCVNERLARDNPAVSSKAKRESPQTGAAGVARPALLDCRGVRIEQRGSRRERPVMDARLATGCGVRVMAQCSLPRTNSDRSTAFRGAGRGRATDPAPAPARVFSGSHTAMPHKKPRSDLQVASTCCWLR